MTTAHATPVRSAIVCGGSLAGLLAARALAEHANVTVFERDVLPAGPEHRTGLPQARHVHLLWSGGAQAVEALAPGTLDALTAHGARRLPVPRDMVALSPQGWFPRWTASHYMILCSRVLLDFVVRQQVLAHPRVTVVDGATVLGLRGDAGAVTGVRIRRGEAEESHAADLVVDATGRGSRATAWLHELGLPAPGQRTIDPGITYASRLFRAPERAARHGWPVINIQADPRSAGPSRAGVLLPIEDGQWLVTLIGTRGGQPTSDPEDFIPYARSLRHPVIGHLIAGATPLSEVTVTHSTANRRTRYERARRWPDGLVVLGDALAAYNPVYGHGMSVAAQSALAVRDTITRHGWRPGLARRIQKAVARPVTAAWDLAVGQDVFYPGAEPGPTLRDKATAAYVDRLMATSTGNEDVAHAVTQVTSLTRGAHTLLTPRMLLAALRGPRRPPLAGPPLTDEELAAAGVHGVAPESPRDQSYPVGSETEDAR